MYTAELDVASDPDGARAVREGLTAYNRSRVGADGYRELTIFLRDPDRAVVGGLLGHSRYFMQKNLSPSALVDGESIDQPPGDMLQDGA